MTSKAAPKSVKKRTRTVQEILEDVAAGKKVSLKEAAQVRARRWDGADDEAFEILQIAASMGHYSMDEKRKLIATRLRKIAQGPRKWGVMR